MKTICGFFAATMLLAMSHASMADFVTVERAYEVPLSMYRMPATTAGSVAFKTCDHCDTQNVRVGANTRYVLNNESISLADFRKALARVNDRRHVFIIVLHHLESDTITSVTANL